MPERVETSLLVVEDFTDADGTEYRTGDRASLARAAVRRAALERPALFRVEWGSDEFDPHADWFQNIVADYQRRYLELKARRDSEAERREQALRVELKAQDRGQPELERRYKRQEKEREQRAKKAREALEREQIERELELGLGPGVRG